MAQEAGSGLEVAVAVGALRSDRDLAALHEPAWVPVIEGRIGWRITPTTAFGAGGWFGEIEAGADTLDEAPRGRSLRGVGVALDLTPWADRGRAAQPVLRFGVESVSLDDGLDRGPAFLVGAGLEGWLGRSWSVAGRIENRFLTIERPSVDGVSTSRDVALWSLGVGLAWGPRRP